jgi:hypothetical protein
MPARTDEQVEEDIDRAAYRKDSVFLYQFIRKHLKDRK